MAEAAEELQVMWSRLPRSRRATLSRAASRGERGASRQDAALMLWWAQRELRRGAWPAIRLALAVVIAVVVVQALVEGGRIGGFDGILQSAPLLPLLLMIPAAAWTLRRPKLQRSAQRNAALLAGRGFDAPPDAEQTQRLLERARKERWYRDARPAADG